MRSSNRILSEGGGVTSITTMANENVSDIYVGRTDSDFPLSFAFVDNARSSGARQRVEPLPFGVEALAEKLFIVIDENPKSVKRGLPLRSIRMFDWISCSVRRRVGR